MAGFFSRRTDTPAVSVPNLKNLEAKEAQLLEELNRIREQIRGLQDEAKTFFEAVKKEKYGFEYEEKILKDFINKLTILMGQLALQFRAVAGIVKGGYAADTFHISLYDQISGLKRNMDSLFNEVFRRARYSKYPLVYLGEVSNIISAAQRDDGYNVDKTPYSTLRSITAQALNDILWVALQLKEFKKLLSRTTSQ